MMVNSQRNLDSARSSSDTTAAGPATEPDDAFTLSICREGMAKLCLWCAHLGVSVCLVVKCSRRFVDVVVKVAVCSLFLLFFWGDFTDFLIW
jgi:hypothetical protein